MKTARRPFVDSLLSVLLVAVGALALLAFIVSPWVFADAVGIVAFGGFCLSTIPAAR